MTGFTRAVRSVIIEREDGHCAICERLVIDTSTGRQLAEFSLQHRRARGMGGSRDTATSLPSNGLLLCGSATTGCHHHVESQPAWALDRGYRVRQGDDPARVPVRVQGAGWVLLDPTEPRYIPTAAPVGWEAA